jgi:hypothetical protein
VGHTPVGRGRKVPVSGSSTKNLIYLVGAIKESILLLLLCLLACLASCFTSFLPSDRARQPRTEPAGVEGETGSGGRDQSLSLSMSILS